MENGVITPTTLITNINSGGPTGTIATITNPFGTQEAGALFLIPKFGFTTNTSGNIALASTGMTGRTLIMTYDPSGNKWYPSY